MTVAKYEERGWRITSAISACASTPVATDRSRCGGSAWHYGYYGRPHNVSSARRLLPGSASDVAAPSRLASVCPFHASLALGRRREYDADYSREEPGPGKPHARICDSESRMAELLEHDPGSCRDALKGGAWRPGFARRQAGGERNEHPAILASGPNTQPFAQAPHGGGPAVGKGALR